MNVRFKNAVPACPYMLDIFHRPSTIKIEKYFNFLEGFFVMVRRSGFRHKFKKLNQKTRQSIKRFAGCRRYVYNKALAIQIERRERGENFLSYVDLANLLPVWKKDPDTPWLKEAPAQTLQRSLKDLDRAFQNFYAKRAGFPVFKRKGRGDSFRFPEPKQFELDQINARIKLPKPGWLRYHKSREIEGVPKNVTVQAEADGFFFAVQTEIEVEAPKPAVGPAVGVDLGIVRFATLSDGTVYEPLNSFRRHEKNSRRRQRALSRKREAAKKLAKANQAKTGGKGPPKITFGSNYHKAKRQLAKAHKKIANCRKDYLHKVSATISKNHALVFAEALKIQNMSASAAGNRENPGKNVKAKSGLNRSILDQGWGMFRILLEYKLKKRGGELILVPPHFTSQRCPVCGHVDQANRKSQAKFKCLACGYENNADLAGAMNILAAGQAAMARGGLGAQGPPMKREPSEGI